MDCVVAIPSKNVDLRKRYITPFTMSDYILMSLMEKMEVLLFICFNCTYFEKTLAKIFLFADKIDLSLYASASEIITFSIFYNSAQ